MTVEEVNQRVSPTEFKWWMAYNRMSPIGPERQDYNFAMLASVLVNIHKTKGKAVAIKDMVLKWGKPKKAAQGIDQMVKILKSIPGMKFSKE
jgi:hypothetical protein